MKKLLGILLVLVIIGGAGAGVWWYTHRPEPFRELTLYGNVDLREVRLAFNGAERIASLLVEEGDPVKPGQVVARLQTQRLEAAERQAQAQVAAQRQVVARLENGTRPEEIAQARATVAAAQADASRARLNYDRLHNLAGTGAASAQDIDNARAAVDVAAAQVNVRQEALNLALAGPRKEDIAQAKATLDALQAALDLRKRELDDAVLSSPVTGIVRSRLMEPGEMASPATPVVSIAVTEPKWVRAYITEADLGRIRPGMPALVTTDSTGSHAFDGWVGFISPNAEFTPKTVETPDLRTALVYEVRIFVKDSQNQLRLGTPATVRFPTASPTTAPTTTRAASTMP